MPGAIVEKVREKPKEKPRVGGGGRPPVIDVTRGYGGDGGRGDGAPDANEKLRRYRLGMALALIAISMLFVGVTTVFLLRHHYGGRLNLETATFVRDWLPIPLPFQLLTLNTILLLISSVTMELARRDAIRASILGPVLVIPGIRDDQKRSPWLAITIVLGVAFLSGQTAAWKWVAAQGFLLPYRPSTSFFYLLTVTHALHLAVGLIVLFYAFAAELLRRPAMSRRITVDVASWYWHTMGVLWVYIMILLAVVR